MAGYARYDIPLVADIHFQPKVAMLVADAFEKIRINPGNFADGAKKFDEITYENEVTPHPKPTHPQTEEAGTSAKKHPAGPA